MSSSLDVAVSADIYMKLKTETTSFKRTPKGHTLQYMVGQRLTDIRVSIGLALVSTL